MITEEMLCAAAARSCEIYVSYLERGYTPENQHEFSLQFEKKIKKLKRKADHPVFYHATKRIASIVLAILITGGVREIGNYKAGSKSMQESGAEKA